MVARAACKSSVNFNALLLILLYIVGTYGTLEITVNRIDDETRIPPPNDAVCMARYIVHYSNWCSLSYISKNDNSTLGSPLSRIYSVSDGVPENGTGNVYFMVSPLDLTIQDLLVQNNCSIIMTLAQSHYCMEKKYDAQDPRCAQVILNGNFIQIQNETDPEYTFARTALWTRHPIMKSWFKNEISHKWFFGKMKIEHIAVVDFFGGRKFPTVWDYYHKICERYLNKASSNLQYTTSIN